MNANSDVSDLSQVSSAATITSNNQNQQSPLQIPLEQFQPYQQYLNQPSVPAHQSAEIGFLEGQQQPSLPRFNQVQNPGVAPNSDIRPSPTQAPIRKRRARKTNPAQGENSQKRPPADLTFCTLSSSQTPSNTLPTEIPVDITNLVDNPTSSHSGATYTTPASLSSGNSDSAKDNAIVDKSAFVPYQRFEPEDPSASSRTPGSICFAKLPGAISLLNPEGTLFGYPVFPFNVFHRSDTPLSVCQFTVAERPCELSEIVNKIQTTVYKPTTGTNQIFNQERKLYIIQNGVILVLHKKLQLRETQSIVCPIPIPRVEGVEEPQYLKRIIIARDPGFEAHVNIRVDEGSLGSPEADLNLLQTSGIQSVNQGADLSFISQSLLRSADLNAIANTSIPEHHSASTPGDFTNSTEVGHSVDNIYPGQPSDKLAATTSEVPTVRVNGVNLSKAQAAGMNRERYIAGFLARCMHCGICSVDLHVCSRCRKNLGVDPKIVPDPWYEKKLIVPVSNNTAPVHTTSVAGSTPAASKKHPRRKQIKVKPEECIVLSSDEEELAESNFKNSEETRMKTVCSPKEKTNLIDSNQAVESFDAGDFANSPLVYDPSCPGVQAEINVPTGLPTHTNHISPIMQSSLLHAPGISINITDNPSPMTVKDQVDASPEEGTLHILDKF